MKILFWTDGFWPRIGGTETQGFQFVEKMQKKGHQCLVLAERDHPSMKEEELFKGIRIRRCEFNAIIKNRELKKIRSIREFLEQVTNEFRPDLLYLNTLNNGSAFAFLLFHKLFRAPSVVTIHAPYYENSIPPLVSQICEQVDHVCCASEWGMGVMKRLLPPLKNPLKRISYGLLVPDVPPSLLPFSPPIILLLGRLSSEKGFETAIAAFDLLKQKGSDALLWIAGSGPERPFLEHLVTQAQLESSVRFIGGLPRDDNSVAEVINQSTFVVMTSYLEAFGLVALEAMQMGRPVIASNVGGLPEIVCDGERGLLVPPRDPVALSQAMQTLLENPQEIIRMGKRAREWATQNYLLEDNIHHYEELFKECLQEDLLCGLTLSK